MIYLASRRLLFVKPKKTAGTSVEVALSCNATDADIVTPLLEEDEAIRHRAGGHFPVNWAWRRADEARYRARFDRYLQDGIVPRRWFGLKRGRLYNRLGAKFLNHDPPAKVRRRLGAAAFDAAFLVTMTRHPYEVVVSYANHLRQGTGRPLEPFLERAVRHRPLNDPYYFGPRPPDFVIRYEHLHEDLAALEQRFGLDLVARMPFTKNRARADRRPASEVLSEAQKACIRASHARIFETFGYAP